jgi:hypothetical protein
VDEGGDRRGRHDESPLYCRKLGHPLTFRYCREVAGGLPCGTVLDCWHASFDVAAFLRDGYTPEELASVFRPPRAKLSQIADILASIRKDAGKAGGQGQGEGSS